MYAPIVNTEPIPRTGLGHNNGGVKNVRLSIVRKVWKCEATVQLRVVLWWFYGGAKYS